MSGADDVVELHLGIAEANTVLTCTSYTIDLRIFDCPQTFSLQLGSDQTAFDIMRQYPKGTDFRIDINGQPQFSGYTTGNESEMAAGTGVEVVIAGEDVLGPLCDDEIEKEESFQASTHRELVEKAIAAVNLIKPFEVDPPLVISSNAANRQAVTGQQVTAADDTSEAELLQIAGTAGNAFRVLRTHLAEKRINLLRRHLDAAGLFCWGGASGDVIVGVPNSNQPPLYRLVRRLGRISESNIIGHSFKDSMKPRFSEVVMYGKTTGRKYARTTIKGGYTDDEVVAAGFHKVKVIRDAEITSVAHAEHLAKKELASGRRKGSVLKYHVAGHSAPSLVTAGATRAVFAPDTVVEIEDEMLGISGTYWIESVSHRRGPATITTISLLSPDVLIFGDQAFPAGNAS